MLFMEQNSSNPWNVVCIARNVAGMIVDARMYQSVRRVLSPSRTFPDLHIPGRLPRKHLCHNTRLPVQSLLSDFCIGHARELLLSSVLLSRTGQRLHDTAFSLRRGKRIAEGQPNPQCTLAGPSLLYIC